MTITISTPEIAEKLSEGANAANLTVDEYAETVLRSALSSSLLSDQLPKPSERYTIQLDKSTEAIQAALDVLKSFDEDDLEERRQSAEYLRRALNESRLSSRPLFVNTQGKRT